MPTQTRTTLDDLTDQVEYFDDDGTLVCTSIEPNQAEQARLAADQVVADAKQDTLDAAVVVLDAQADPKVPDPKPSDVISALVGAVRELNERVAKLEGRS